VFDRFSYQLNLCSFFVCPFFVFLCGCGVDDGLLLSFGEAFFFLFKVFVFLLEIFSYLFNLLALFLCQLFFSLCSVDVDSGLFLPLY
jgi:hypothetical protein